MGLLELVCLLCVATVCVEGDYRLEVLFLRLDNLTGMCGDPRCAVNQGCCDSPPSINSTPPCAGLCGYHPRFCVRPLGTMSNSSSDCLQQITLTNFAFNAPSGGFLTFVTGIADFFGTPNPAVFTGPRWPGGIQLFMEVYDLDNGFDVELVDRFTVDVNVSVGSNITADSTGVFGLVELQVNFRVMCVEDFFVLDCATCSGANRDPSTNCSTCLPGYGGSDCTVDLDRCGHTTPCENGATCNNTGPDQYECLCAAGFEGVDCERETNECDPNPCMNGGTCTDLLADYNCSCPAGFSGTNCDQEEGIPETPPPGTLSPGTPPVPVIAGVMGGGLLLLISGVILTVATCLCVRWRKAVLKGHLPPQEDIDLQPNPVYGVSTSDYPSPQEDIDTKPNPVYGVSGARESQDYYALDHTHKTSGDTDDAYDYVN